MVTDFKPTLILNLLVVLVATKLILTSIVISVDLMKELALNV